MKTEQINLRLEPDLLAALERVAREEALDRGTIIRRLLEAAIARWQTEQALRGYQRGELSIGRAAEEAGLTQWELLAAARSEGIAYPLEGEEVEARLADLERESEQRTEGDSGGRTEVVWMGQPVETLADRPPRPGGVLMVGINPAPTSVAAGHYYQGRLGQRLWRRLERLGLLVGPIPGAEDETFVEAGHGLTDLVKRPTTSAGELSQGELTAGIEDLRRKVTDWKPGLILFPYKKAASAVLGTASLGPGPGPDFVGAPTFLLTGPYAARADATRIDGQLRGMVGSPAGATEADRERSHRVTAKDLAAGRIRFPRRTKRFFPSGQGDVEIVLRGTRTIAAYDPRMGPDRERSAVLSVDRDLLRETIREDEILSVSRGVGGVIVLE